MIESTFDISSYLNVDAFEDINDIDITMHELTASEEEPVKFEVNTKENPSVFVADISQTIEWSDNDMGLLLTEAVREENEARASAASRAEAQIQHQSKPEDQISTPLCNREPVQFPIHTQFQVQSPLNKQVQTSVSIPIPSKISSQLLENNYTTPPLSEPRRSRQSSIEHLGTTPGGSSMFSLDGNTSSQDLDSFESSPQDAHRQFISNSEEEEEVGRYNYAIQDPAWETTTHQTFNFCSFNSVQFDPNCQSETIAEGYQSEGHFNSHGVSLVEAVDVMSVDSPESVQIGGGQVLAQEKAFCSSEHIQSMLKKMVISTKATPSVSHSEADKDINPEQPKMFVEEVFPFQEKQIGFSKFSTLPEQVLETQALNDGQTHCMQSRHKRSLSANYSYFQAQDRNQVVPLEYFRIPNKIKADSFPASRDGYYYIANPKAHDPYQPLVLRFREDDRSNVEGLCPYCTVNVIDIRSYDEVFFNIKKSSYVHHLGKNHGVLSDGTRIPDPFLLIDDFIFHEKKRGKQVSGVVEERMVHHMAAVCPHLDCMNMSSMTFHAMPDYNPSKGWFNRLLAYTRHYYECHKKRNLERFIVEPSEENKKVFRQKMEGELGFHEWKTIL
ncbi:BA75_01654T0 [Komagataella pastoris]|uniref:BA75_01654T0 n=1 Tax=Komagataella pastoris TaxID=4922 RepID=A0A1B2J542_PICPA|nr:BA75_01654T0 [Komagataella pastoris]